MRNYLYDVRISRYTHERVMAPDSTSAKGKVWNNIKDGYTYGFKNRLSFMKGTSAQRVRNK